MASAGRTGLKRAITDRIWHAVDNAMYVVSATLVGSFVRSGGLDGISDIDLVLVVDHLDDSRFSELGRQFDEALRPVLDDAGYGLIINPTLGPLKFNDEATAVLHLMLYSVDAHVEHVLSSPFTCLDWQRSGTHRKSSLVEVYPVFGLQPRHFQSTRRSISDYIRDLAEGVVSYRELVCTADGYREVRHTKPMDVRGRHEFAYHVMKFLMQNLLKLLERRESAPDGEALLSQFLMVFPEAAAEIASLYWHLRRRKRALDFSDPVPKLDERTALFVSSFERQFRHVFEETASHHVFFRHAPTHLNRRGVFVGRRDPDIVPFPPEDAHDLADRVASHRPTQCYSSPLRRCLQSIATLRERVDLPEPRSDERLIEIHYGSCDGLQPDQARRTFPELFAAWGRGEDPAFPDGECSGDVVRRVHDFVSESLKGRKFNTAICTHNVVLRCLVGGTLGVPKKDWYRLVIPHMAPFEFVLTQDHGLFLNVAPDVERSVFSNFRGVHRERTTCR